MLVELLLIGGGVFEVWHNTCTSERHQISPVELVTQSRVQVYFDLEGKGYYTAVYVLLCQCDLLAVMHCIF